MWIIRKCFVFFLAFLSISACTPSGTDDHVFKISSTGAFTTISGAAESVTFPGGGGAASVDTTGNPIPDGSWLQFVTTTVTTANNGGACTGYGVGFVAGATDMFGVAAATSVGTTTNATTATASVDNPQFDGPYQIRITGVGGNCIDMVVSVTPHFDAGTAAPN